MATMAQDGSSAMSEHAGAAPPAEAQSDAESKIAKVQASAEAMTDEARLQTIKDRTFWTHGSQVEPTVCALYTVSSSSCCQHMPLQAAACK